MPTTQALQVFYGTIPVMLLLLGIYLRDLTTTKDILARLTGIEGLLREWMPKIEHRLTVLETRAGIVYQGKG
jgi:hypothetical protein